jgi:hypothetical protein
MNDIRLAELKISPFGWGLSAALVVLYVLCWLAVLVSPDFAHGWLGLFSTQPAGSIGGLVIGIVVSAVMGWVTAAVLVPVYNVALRR